MAIEVISIIQQNLTHSEEAEDKFLDHLVKSQAIGLVQEPYLRKNKIKQLNGYRVIQCELVFTFRTVLMCG